MQRFNTYSTSVSLLLAAPSQTVTNHHHKIRSILVCLQKTDKQKKKITASSLAPDRQES